MLGERGDTGLEGLHAIVAGVSLVTNLPQQLRPRRSPAAGIPQWLILLARSATVRSPNSRGLIQGGAGAARERRSGIAPEGALTMQTAPALLVQGSGARARAIWRRPPAPARTPPRLR